MTVQFFNTHNDYRDVTKSLTQVGNNYDVILKEDTPIEKPVLIMTGHYINANYCKIPVFNDRYYFITSQTVLTGNRVEISLAVDVLTTYQANIRNSTQLIVRQENAGVNEIVDTQLPLKNGSNLTIVQFPNSPFFDGFTQGTKCFLLNVIGVQGVNENE